MKKQPFILNAFAPMCLWVFFCANPVRATIYYVDASKPAGGDGLSWATAFNNIQDAVDQTNPIWIVCTAPVDRVWVKQGTYNVTSEIVLGSADLVYGGFPSSIADPVWDDRSPNTYATIIDGGDTTRCVRISGYAILDGFTIQNGSAVSGGGLYIDADPIDCGITGYLSPYVQNCKFQYNAATTGGGGAIYDMQSDAHIRYCEFSYNTSGTGGAIYQYGSGTEITRCVFHHNENTAAGSLGGGAVAGAQHNTTTGKYMAYTNCLFYSNHSESWGGAVSGNQTYPIIKNCTFADNSADIIGGAFHGNTNSEAPKIWNCICWNDTPDELDIVTSSAYLDVSYSDIEGGWAGPGSNNIDADPDFKGTAYHLDMGSPCIDTGNNAYAPADDLDGQTRPLDGDGNGSAIADMGAYEEVYTNVDLVVESITFDPEYPRLGQVCSVTVTIRNQGTTDAGAFWLDWYASEVIEPIPYQVGDRYMRVNSLAAGDATSMTRTYTYDDAAGQHWTWAQVDTNLEVEETWENNNTLGPQLVRVIDGQILEFNTLEDSYNANRWFGGDDRPGMIRNLGVGQSMIFARDGIVDTVGFRFQGCFDYYENPDGYGHEVRLVLNIRNSTGGLLEILYKDLPETFKGGWVDFEIPNDGLWVFAGQDYIFTCYLYKGEMLKYYNSVYARADNPWPLSQGYTCTQTGTPADMETWANWTTSSLDFNFHIAGRYVEPYPGDLNEDRAVNLNDAAALGLSWIREDCVMLDWCGWTDVNWSTDVGLEDLKVVGEYWLNTYYDYDDLNRAAVESMQSQLSGDNIDASDGNEFNPGTYFVCRTSAGRYGKFIVENWEPGGATDNRLTIGWVTYNADGTVYTSGSGLVIRGTYSCDLDLGLETSINSDFTWVQYSAAERWLDPRNGALFKLMYRAP